MPWHGYWHLCHPCKHPTLGLGQIQEFKTESFLSNCFISQPWQNLKNEVSQSLRNAVHTNDEHRSGLSTCHRLLGSCHSVFTISLRVWAMNPQPGHWVKAASWARHQAQTNVLAPHRCLYQIRRVRASWTCPGRKPQPNRGQHVCATWLWAGGHAQRVLNDFLNFFVAANVTPSFFLALLLSSLSSLKPIFAKRSYSGTIRGTKRKKTDYKPF